MMTTQEKKYICIHIYSQCHSQICPYHDMCVACFKAYDLSFVYMFLLTNNREMQETASLFAASKIVQLSLCHFPSFLT